MEKIYLLKQDKVMLGPYTLDKLKEKGLKPSDLVWYEGLADWTPAGNLSALNAQSGKSNLSSKEKTSFFSFLKKIFASNKF